MPRFTGTSTPPTTAAPYNSGTLIAGLADRVTGLVYSDTAGNLHIDHGFSGSDWSIAHTETIAHPGGSTIKFSAELVSPYYRIRFVPTTNPTAFRLAARQSSAGSR